MKIDPKLQQYENSQVKLSRFLQPVSHLHSEAGVPMSNQGICSKVLPGDEVVERNTCAAIPGGKGGPLGAQTHAPDVTWI